MSRKSCETKLDKLWRLKNKEIAVCEICATLPPKDRIKYNQLHPHHIVGRKNKLLRWDLANRLWCCPFHHTMGGSSQTVQDNLGGWFINWESDNDWMGKHRPEDKKYLKERHTIPYKKWTLDELRALIDQLSA